jgi:hypothetical protein
MNMLGEGVNNMGSIGSSVMVGRIVAVHVGRAVWVTESVEEVGAMVLSTNKSGVFVGSNA